MTRGNDANQLPPADQCPASLQATATLECTSACLSCWAGCYMVGNISLLWVSYLSCVSSQIPCLLVAEWEMEKAVMQYKHWSAVAETLVCYQHLFGQKSKTQHYTGCYEESQLHASQTQYTIWSPCPTEVGCCHFLLIMLSSFLFSLLHSERRVINGFVKITVTWVSVSYLNTE